MDDPASSANDNTSQLRRLKRRERLLRRKQRLLDQFSKSQNQSHHLLTDAAIGDVNPAYQFGNGAIAGTMFDTTLVLNSDSSINVVDRSSYLWDRSDFVSDSVGSHGNLYSPLLPAADRKLLERRQNHNKQRHSVISAPSTAALVESGRLLDRLNALAVAADEMLLDDKDDNEDDEFGGGGDDLLQGRDTGDSPSASMSPDSGTLEERRQDAVGGGANKSKRGFFSTLMGDDEGQEGTETESEPQRYSDDDEDEDGPVPGMGVLQITGSDEMGYENNRSSPQHYQPHIHIHDSSTDDPSDERSQRHPSRNKARNAQQAFSNDSIVVARYKGSPGTPFTDGGDDLSLRSEPTSINHQHPATTTSTSQQQLLSAPVQQKGRSQQHLGQSHSPPLQNNSFRSGAGGGMAAVGAGNNSAVGGISVSIPSLTFAFSVVSENSMPLTSVVDGYSYSYSCSPAQHSLQDDQAFFPQLDEDPLIDHHSNPNSNFRRYENPTNSVSSGLYYHTYTAPAVDTHVTSREMFRLSLDILRVLQGSDRGHGWLRDGVPRALFTSLASICEAGPGRGRMIAVKTSADRMYTSTALSDVRNFVSTHVEDALNAIDQLPPLSVRLFNDLNQTRCKDRLNGGVRGHDRLSVDISQHAARRHTRHIHVRQFVAASVAAYRFSMAPWVSGLLGASTLISTAPIDTNRWEVDDVVGPDWERCRLRRSFHAASSSSTSQILYRHPSAIQLLTAPSISPSSPPSSLNLMMTDVELLERHAIDAVPRVWDVDAVEDRFPCTLVATGYSTRAVLASGLVEIVE
jgi:hypothetical protein